MFTIRCTILSQLYSAIQESVDGEWLGSGWVRMSAVASAISITFVPQIEPREYLVARYWARLSGAVVVSTGMPHVMASSTAIPNPSRTESETKSRDALMSEYRFLLFCYVIAEFNR